MKNTKKLLSVILGLIIVAMTVFTSCSKSESSGADDTLKVGVVQYVSHPSLDNCYEGIKSALEASEIASDIEIDRQTGSDASPDADCSTYAKNMVANKYDLIIAIATPAATAVYAATEGTDIPVVFCAVSDPVAAKLVESLEKPGDICTGTSDVLDLEAQVDLIQAMQPDIKTIGILYTTSEANSITQLGLIKDIAKERGLTIEASGVQNASDIPAAANALVSKVDCINNFTDNNVVNNLSVLLDAANAAKIPVYGSEVEQVKNGCLAAVSIDYVALGKTTGDMAVEILGGADASKMPVKIFKDTTPVVNTDSLAFLGMTMPEAYTNAETVTTNK